MEKKKKLAQNILETVVQLIIYYEHDIYSFQPRATRWNHGNMSVWLTSFKDDKYEPCT